MSQESNLKWWITSKKQLENLQIRDQLIQEGTKLVKDQSIANHLVGGLFARYSLIVQDLCSCLDQYCQIQKRFTMKKLVDAAVTRLNDLKEELVKINMSEYFYIDGNIIELKLVPHQIEILDPAFVCDRELHIEDLWTKIKKGETIYTPPPPPPPPPEAERTSGEIQIPEEDVPPAQGDTPAEETETSPTEPAEEDKDQKKKKKKRASVQKFIPPTKVLTAEEIEEEKRKERISAAMLLIQTNERGRQERLYYGDLNARRQLRVKAASGQLQPNTPVEVQEMAALNIQRVYRGFGDRENLKRLELNRRFVINMIEPSWKSSAEQDKVQKTIELRRAIREQHLREYVNANVDEKIRILRVVAPGLMEDISDEIREWFYQWYLRAKNFDKYPPEEAGGSILVVRGETFTPEEWIDEVERLRREKAKNQGKGKGDEKAKEKAKKKALKKQEADKRKKEAAKKKKELEAIRKLEEKGEFQWNFMKSVAFEQCQAGFKEYKELWGERPDSENPEMKPYMDIITDEKCYEVQLQVRALVDELMRIELDMLNQALELDRDKAKAKKGKKDNKEKKEKKGKGEKGKKGKKGKKNKDPTWMRSTADLFQELVDNGIIRTYPKANLSEFKGDFSYCNWEKRNLEFDPLPTLGDVRQAVMLNCILPLGPDSMAKPKSVLIAGHRQSGKHLLANAIFYETRCVLFDISPPILVGKYPGNKGMKKLLHLINKMSRILQPSVIFIDGGEKPFYKKVPNEEIDLDPKKMGKQLFKGIVKPIKPGDKVLVLAISNQPFSGKASGINKAFERLILIPRTDYGSVFLYWRELLMPYHGVDRNFNMSELAKLTVTYPLPDLKAAAEKVMVPDRIVCLKRRPLDSHEFIEVLLDMPEPVVDKEWKKFEKWFKNTKLQKKREVYMVIAEQNRAQEAKGGGKDKKKKK